MKGFNESVSDLKVINLETLKKINMVGLLLKYGPILQTKLQKITQLFGSNQANIVKSILMVNVLPLFTHFYTGPKLKLSTSLFFDKLNVLNIDFPNTDSNSVFTISPKSSDSKSTSPPSPPVNVNKGQSNIGGTPEVKKQRNTTDGTRLRTTPDNSDRNPRNRVLLPTTNSSGSTTPTTTPSSTSSPRTPHEPELNIKINLTPDLQLKESDIRVLRSSLNPNDEEKKLKLEIRSVSKKLRELEKEYMKKKDKYINVESFNPNNLLNINQMDNIHRSITKLRKKLFDLQKKLETKFTKKIHKLLDKKKKSKTNEVVVLDIKVNILKHKLDALRKKMLRRVMAKELESEIDIIMTNNESCPVECKCR
jgi:hypothetical protein